MCPRHSNSNFYPGVVRTQTKITIIYEKHDTTNKFVQIKIKSIISRRINPAKRFATIYSNTVLLAMSKC